MLWHGVVDSICVNNTVKPTHGGMHQEKGYSALGCLGPVAWSLEAADFSTGSHWLEGGRS